MSSYGEPDTGHRNAVNQVTDARQRALTAVSEIRKTDIQTPHPNLAPPTAPIEGNDTPSLPVACSQAVVDYLLQLRPYRHHSDNWHIDFGEIQLPENINPKSSVFGRKDSELTLDGGGVISLNSVNKVIKAVNTTVEYQNVKQRRRLGGGWKAETERYKIVFSPGTLLEIVETADEIAAEMDMLAELTPPDHSSGGGDAV